MVPKEKLLVLNGVRVMVFSVKYLAQALKRTQWTIRSWERKGIIAKPVLAVTMGKTQQRWRWYTQDEVDMYVRLLQHTNVQNGMSIEGTGFPKLVRLEMLSIREKYRKLLGA